MRLRNKLVAAGCVVVATAALVTGVACNDHELSPFSKSLSAGKLQGVSSGSARAVDILFVVDNSSSMDNEQKSLDGNFTEFLDRLIDANADFHLATVSTEWGGNAVVSFETQALSAANINSTAYTGGVRPQEVLGLDESEISKIARECSDYFGSERRYISSTDEEIASKSGDELKEYVRNLFRCESILGTKPGAAGIERGLATAVSALMNDANNAPGQFKRDGSILAVVFVTDENDCSDVLDEASTELSAKSDWIKDDLNACETHRNIEDSCIVTRDDRVVSDAKSGSSLRLSSGDAITYNGKTMTTRQWCIQGNNEAREALHAHYDKCIEKHVRDAGEGEEINADAYEKYASACRDEINIDCPKGKCRDGLTSRSYLFEKVIGLVESTNRAYYESTNKEQLAAAADDAEKDALIRSFAKQDVIIANIINRDRGVRYETGVTDRWCGGSGNPSYRYQWFGEMFENDPIYAPICCRNEEFKTQSSSTEAAELVCEKGDNGVNAKFGPVLGLIGKRIGEAINTICADTPPLTCEPKDCNVPLEDNKGYTNEPLESPKPACPCLYGCNINSKWPGSEREYNLCNEFRINIGTIAGNVKTLSSSDESYQPYKLDTDYSIDYESSYCYTRTASPLQINLHKAEAGRQLVIEYPKRVSAN